MIMLRMIQEANYEFRPEQWDAISSDAKELVRVWPTLSRADNLSIVSDQKFARYRRAESFYGEYVFETSVDGIYGSDRTAQGCPESPFPTRGAHGSLPLPAAEDEGS